MENMGTSNKNDDKNNNLNNDPSNEKSNEMIDTQTNENENTNALNEGIHPLTQELKDMTFLQEENSIDTNPVKPAIARDANIGAMLKRVREEKGHSIKVVSQQTKIHLALLEALEDNQLIRLPSKTYVKGFVKSYAKLLNIPQNDAIELFENTYREYEGLPPIQTNIIKESATSSEVPKAKKEFNNAETISEITNIASHNGGLLLKVGLGIFVLAIVGINIKSMIERSVDDAPQELPEVISTTTKPKKIETTTTPVVAATTATTPDATTQAAAVTTPTVNIITKETIKPDVKISDELTLKPISTLEKQQKDISMSKEDMDQFLPARFRAATGGGLEYVFINATEGDSWLTYKTDGNEIKKFVLRQGRTLFLKGKEIRLFVGNTKNVKVFYNNKPIEFVTNTGAKNAVFPESLRSKFMMPLFVFQKDGAVITSEEAAEKAKVSTSTKPANTSVAAPATAPVTTPVNTPAATKTVR